MTDSQISPLEAHLQRGDALRRMACALTARLGRREADAEAPEIVEARRLYGLLVDWDRSNVEALRRLLPRGVEIIERYAAIERPDKQLCITDFGSVRARVAQGIAEKLALLRAVETALIEGQGVVNAHSLRPDRVFLGHGRSPAWRALKEFISERLGLAVEEFNATAVAGSTITQRLNELRERCTFAVLVFTAEVQHVDGTWHARENVVHEAGLFAAELGWQRTILCVQSGCSVPSNLDGTLQLRFDGENLSACFEELRAVLEREGLLRRSAA